MLELAKIIIRWLCTIEKLEMKREIKKNEKIMKWNNLFIYKKYFNKNIMIRGK